MYSTTVLLLKLTTHRSPEGSKTRPSGPSSIPPGSGVIIALAGGIRLSSWPARYSTTVLEL